MQRFASILPLLIAVLFQFEVQGELIVDVDHHGQIRDAVLNGNGTTNYTTNTFTFTVSNAPSVITNLHFRFSASHTFVNDLDIRLYSPLGTEAYIAQNVGESGDNFQDTYFDEEGGLLLINSTNTPPDFAPYPGPEYGGVRYKTVYYSAALTNSAGLNQFYGQNPNGVWALKVIDIAPGDTGFLYESGDNSGAQNWGPVIGTQLIINPLRQMMVTRVQNALTNCVITFTNLITNQVYAVQTTTNSSLTGWTNETSFVATQISRVWTNNMGGAAQKFYRLAR